MTINANDAEPGNRFEPVINVYLRALSILLLVRGLWQWAVIMGVVAGTGGPFEAMSTPWRLATMHLAVVDLVAAVGLWQRVAWGKVLWIYAALAEIAMHTVLATTFGHDLPIVAFHVATLAAFGGLQILARRAEPA